VAIVSIVAFIVVASLVYYYYTNYTDVVNVQLSISVGRGVPATIPSLGVTVHAESSVVSSSCSTSAGGTTAYCQIRMPNGGANNGGIASLQVQLAFSSPGCAYPKPTVDSDSLTISQDFSRPDTFCNSFGTATYYLVLISGATGYLPPLGSETAVAAITFAGSNQSS